MADSEKVVAGLTMLADTKNDDSCEGLKCCKIAEDALELLKEQDRLLCKKQKEIDKLQADYSMLRHKFLEKTQIVRCKDCKHYNHEKKWCQHMMVADGGNWFCADGEARQ